MTARLAPERSSGKPPPMDLARQITSGFTPKIRWRRPTPAWRGLHFVEDQQRAVLAANIAQPLQEAGCGMHSPTFIKIGSRMIAAICPGYCLKRFSTLFQIVEAGDDNILE